MGFISGLIKFISDGGIWMWPIIVSGAIGFAMFFERYRLLASVRNKNRKTWDALHPVLSAGDFDKARKMTENDTSTIGRLLNQGLALQGAVRRRDDIEIGLEEAMMEIIPQLEKRTHYIGLLANVAT